MLNVRTVNANLSLVLTSYIGGNNNPLEPLCQKPLSLESA